MKSTCQLAMGGDNPARNSDYGCEFTARQHLLDAWEKQCAEHEGAADPYLDDLTLVREAGFLDEYTVHYFGRKHWQVPAEVPQSADAADRFLELRPQALSFAIWW
jgi:hypothetical protein